MLSLLNFNFFLTLYETFAMMMMVLELLMFLRGFKLLAKDG